MGIVATALSPVALLAKFPEFEILYEEIAEYIQRRSYEEPDPVTVKASSVTSISTPAVKLCPYCGETINAAATLCLFCSKALPRPPRP